MILLLMQCMHETSESRDHMYFGVSFGGGGGGYPE